MKTSARPTPDTGSPVGSSWPSTRYRDPTHQGQISDTQFSEYRVTSDFCRLSYFLLNIFPDLDL